MKKLKRGIIKEEFIAITGDTIESIILNQFMFWSERVSDYDNFIQEENERQEKYFIPSDKNIKPNKIELIHGWIYKKAAEMKDEIMVSETEKTISRKIDNLVKKGFLDRRNNPQVKYDRTYQYRLNYENIIKELVKNGYTLEGYKIDLNIYKNILYVSNINKRQNVACVEQNDDSKGQIVALKRQIEDLKSQIVALNSHKVGAIPKITTKITTKTTTEENNEVNQDIFNLFNTICTNLSTAIKLSDGRKRAIKSILEKYKDIEVIKEVFTKANKSNFLTGDNERGWTADFDWILKESNFIKILEGKYDNKNPKQKGTFNNFEQRTYSDEFIKQLEAAHRG